MNYKQQLDRSSLAFIQLIRPWLECELGGIVLPVENVNHQALLALDQIAGFDALLIKGGCSGIASRVAFMDRRSQPFNRFEVRYKRKNGRPTEYKKRLEAILTNGKFLYPFYWVHSYIKDNRILSCALTETAQLMKYIVSYDPPVHEIRHYGHSFLYKVDWDLYASRGFWVRVLDNTQTYCYQQSLLS